MEKKKVIINITKPEDIDNVRIHQWMHFTCKNCGKDTLLKFATFRDIDHYKRMLCKNCGIKQTCLEKYGSERPLQSPEIKEKMKQTCLKKYGVGWTSKMPEFQEKRKQTWFEKYGVESPLQSPEFQEKRKQTLFEKYGVESPLQSPEIEEKRKQTWFEKYGVENPLQSPEIEEKRKQTLFEKYGVESPLQSPKFQSKSNKKYDYFGVKLDSSWELYYYIYQTEVLGFECIRNYGEKYFEYIVNGKTHRYIPDFINEGKIVEIKGDQFLKNGNLINAYNSKYLSKEILSVKTQCMLDNVDEIITRKEITPMIREVKRLFGVHYIDQFKVKKDEEGLKAS